MSYNVTVYKDTGFVGGNIPDSPALLGAGVPKQAVEILQDGELSSVKLGIEWNEAKLVDYIKVGSVYYIVQGRRMLATDVCEFDILEDGITTIGGVSQIQILDGITERCHLPNSANGDKDDPLLAPQDPLLLDIQQIGEPDGDYASYVTVIETTVDPLATKNAAEALEYAGTDYSVNIPKPVPYTNEALTLYSIPAYNEVSGNEVEVDIETTRATGLEMVALRNSPFGYDSQGSVVTLSKKANIDEAVAELRALGLDSCIINQIEYPIAMVDFIMAGVGSGSTNIDKIKGKFANAGDANKLPFVYANNINNDIIFLSDYTKYGLMTASGAKSEFTVKSIKDPDKTFAQETHPKVKLLSDPNPDGKPYYRYEFYEGNNKKAAFLANAIPGLSWKQVPIVFTGKSGSELDRINFETERYVNERNFQANRAATEMSTFLNSSAMAVGGVANAQGNPAWLAGNMAIPVSNVLDMGVKNVYENEAYRNDKYKSLVKFELSQVASPQLNFAYVSEPLRIQLGNGALAYRYKYTDNDLARIDKLITMYGVKTTRALEASMFTSRRYFNFIKCDDVTVIGNTRHLNEVVSAQLRGGVRIWHVKPDPAKYLTENI